MTTCHIVKNVTKSVWKKHEFKYQISTHNVRYLPNKFKRLKCLRSIS